MLRFTEFLNEAVDKKVTFKKFVTGIFDDLKLVKKNYTTLDKKPSFSNVDVQRATFSFENYPSYDELNKVSAMATVDERRAYAKKKQAEYEKWHKGIAAMLDLKTHPQFKQDGGDVYYIYKETLSNGFTIEYKSTLNHVNHSWRDSFVIEGAKAKDGDTEFKEFPEYKPGTIVYTEYGYSMTIVEFFQIVKRSGNTCYLKRIASKVVDGTDGMYGKKVAVKDTFIDNTIYSARLPKMKYKEKHSYFWLWNGKPIYFNHMD